MKLNAYDLWCVKSNLNSIEQGADPKVIIATLRGNGYHKIADEVEKRMKE
jgi:hypothetical protein